MLLVSFRSPPDPVFFLWLTSPPPDTILDLVLGDFYAKNPTWHCRARYDVNLIVQSFLDLYPNIDLTVSLELTRIPLDHPHLLDILDILLANNWNYSIILSILTQLFSGHLPVPLFVESRPTHICANINKPQKIGSSSINFWSNLSPSITLSTPIILTPPPPSLNPKYPLSSIPLWNLKHTHHYFRLTSDITAFMKIRNHLRKSF